MKAKPIFGALAQVNHVRTASAAELDGDLDPIADEIFGQPDFSTGAAPTTATATNLNQPNALFVYDLTGQLFMADAAHNRVLIWNSVDSYLDGDPADVGLGPRLGRALPLARRDDAARAAPHSAAPRSQPGAA